MKKALSVFLTAALAFGAFADEPVADVNIAEFSGNAAVQWGVDLDSMKTGFKNSYEVNLKLNLLNNGTKSTTGDGVWGELVLKTEEDTFIGWENGDDSPEVGDAYINANTGLMGGGRNFGLKVYVDVAKIHIGPAYIGIERDDTQTGKLKMMAAIRSADSDQAYTIPKTGPEGFTEGIVAGFENDLLKLDLDLRSKPGVKSTDRGVVYVARGNGVATGNLQAGDVIHYADGGTYTVTSADVSNGPVAVPGLGQTVAGVNTIKSLNQYTDNYAAALEAELKGAGLGLDGLSVKAGVSYNFARRYFESAVEHNGGVGVTSTKPYNTPYHTLGYSASAAFGLPLGTDFTLFPQVGFSGQTGFTNNDAVANDETKLNLAANVFLGWGTTEDKNAGVYYLDDDMAKKVTPGVGLIMEIPLATVSNSKSKSTEVKTHTTLYGKEVFRMIPTFYSGELIPGLTAAAYADVRFMSNKTATDNKVDGAGSKDVKATNYTGAVNKDVAAAFVLAAQYAIPVGEMTITPKFGMRFANASYADNGYLDTATGDGANPIFPGEGDAGMGWQKDKVGGGNDGNFMNLKAGVDFGGLIDNTTLSVIYDSRNLLNGYDYSSAYGPKLGTLNFKAKISL